MSVKAIQCGNNYLVLFALLGITQSFHFCTLEEYYSGGLFLGIGNGVTDASVIFIGLFIFTGFVGNDWFLNKLPIGLGGQ
jgi:hypothetical protein